MNKSLITLAALGLSTLLGAQEAPAPAHLLPSQAFARWQADHPGAWILREERSTQSGRFLYGSTLAPDFTPTSEGDFVTLAYQALERTEAMFRIEAETLVPVRVHRLPLRLAGGTDKISVEFAQEVHGVPVTGASMHFLFLTDGRLVAIDNKAQPGVADLGTAPTVSTDSASRIAQSAFRDLEDRRAETTSMPQLEIYPWIPGKLAEPRLAWAIELRAESGSGLPAGRRIHVAADGEPMVLGDDRLVHDCGFDHDHTGGNGPNDLQGHVDSWASPGTLPDKGSNPEVLMPMRYLRVSGSPGTTNTGASGNFVLPYTGSADVDLTFEYRGPWCLVVNQAGTTYSYTQTFSPGVSADAVMNAGKTEHDTAHANAYRSVNDFHDWLVAIDPGDTTMDFQARTNVNINDNCNAYFNGSSINFFTSGGGCVNTAFTTVVAHEEGHWANVRYGIGNGSDGFGEGAADVWAMYIYDTPFVGEDFCGTGCDIRSGLNTRQFCGDNNGGCYGEVHRDGEVLMGAMWKVRANLNSSLGDAAGDLVADSLLVGWFNAYNDGQIRSVIEDHWLALDDDDGNIGNGTPNFTEIDDGFRAQGFPGVDLDYIQIVHTPLNDTQNEAGPYTVAADLTPLMGTAITSATVHYTVDGGAEQSSAMTPQGGATWATNLPGQASPSQVSYWITATDDLGNSQSFPSQGGLDFLVGLRKIHYFTDFEEAGDNGWTHVYGGGTSNSHDDWQHDSPKGQGGDPSVAYSGNLIWGNDVGNSGWNGLYQSNVNIRLQSPAIDLTGQTGVRLRFARWLTVEEGIYDNARVRVNNIKVWENQANGNHVDSAWTMQDYDVSAEADNQAGVDIRFVLQSDGGLELGGWNVDDVMLYSLMPSGSNDSVLLKGDSAPIAGGTANYDFLNAPAGGTWYAVYSPSNAGTVFAGHNFDVGPGYQIALTGGVDENGKGAFSLPVPPSASGMTVYLEVATVDGDGALADSNLLTVTVQ